MVTKLVRIRVNTFTFPIKKGTPVNQYGLLCNGTGAIGVVADTYSEAPVSGIVRAIVAGTLDIATWQAAYGSNYTEDAIKAMDGITWLAADGTRVPDHHDQYVLPAASSSKIGGVKLAANVAASEATDVAGCVTSINAILTALKAAGIMAADTE